MQAGRGGPLVSHLFFADDMLLFAETSTKQIEVILRCLEVFYESSGQLVSQIMLAMFWLVIFVEIVVSPRPATLVSTWESPYSTKKLLLQPMLIS